MTWSIPCRCSSRDRVSGGPMPNDTDTAGGARGPSGTLVPNRKELRRWLKWLALLTTVATNLSTLSQLLVQFVETVATML
jgi:hypothetical protein